MFVFDNLSDGLGLVKLTSELAKQITALIAEQSKEAPDGLALINLTRAVADTLRRLGELSGESAQGPEISPKEEVAKPAGDAPTAHFYPGADRRTQGLRQKENQAAVDLMRQIMQRDSTAPVTDEERAILAKYSGNGGNLVGADGKKGSPYEYYTPPQMAGAMWELAKEMGFSGGKVLDPSSGSGVFAATRPKSAVMEQVELDETSGAINGLVNNSETCSTVVSSFEAIAANTPDETHDAVITNVPFGSVTARGKNRFADSKYQDRPLEAYFILRSLQKLKAGGLALFIVPPRVVSGLDAKMRDLRLEASFMAEFMGAYRLPNKVFSQSTDADTITDVVVFRKFSRDAREKINELAEQNQAALREANVLWDQFLSGQYFKGEGKRFVLGEFQAKDPNKVRDVDRVLNDDSVSNIARLLKKFPGSRIDWKALEAAETTPITYQDGDVVAIAGETLEFRSGEWVKRENTGADDERMAEIGAKLESPMGAVVAGISWEDADAWISLQRDRARFMDMPAWITSVFDALHGIAEGKRAGWWDALTAGLAVKEALDFHVKSGPFNYAEAYPELTARLREVISYGSKSEGGFPQRLRDASRLIGVVISKREGLSAVWRGDHKADVEQAELTPTQRYEKLKYEEADDYGYVPLHKLSAQMGADFDAFASDEWCVSPDGSGAIRADDYFHGNYHDYLISSDVELSAATDPKVRDKLLRQRESARSRLIVPDVGRMSFNLFTPYVSAAQKVEFLRQNVDSRFMLEWDDDGKPQIVVNISSPKTEHERQLKRYAEHLRQGTLSTRTNEADAAANPAMEAARIAQLKELVGSTNAKFNVWVKSNPDAYEAVRARVQDPKSLFFRQVEDESPLTIPGAHPDFKAHTYQNGEIRRQAKKFGGINGFNVGLGKTATALLAVQYVQSIGVKKKTVFILPNGVLSNWRKEAMVGEGAPGEPGYKPPVLASGDDCLFVGMDVSADGSISISSANYARDLNRILENKHRKVFMTLEAFKMIPMREETLARYESYIALMDPSYATATDKKAEEIAKEGKKAKLTMTGGKSGSVPFFEDMGFDSMVDDEGHMFKNSKSLVEFKSAKYLSTPQASDRGADMQIKAWYIRSLSDKNDGVMTLTATPITNSPLEIYGMLSIAIGEEELSQRLGGIRGADEFMSVFAEVENMEELDLVGRPRMGRVFLGLQNVSILRNALREVANIKDASDVGEAISVPDEDPQAIGVELSSDAKKRLSSYKSLYITAKSALKEEYIPEDAKRALDSYVAMSGEPVELLAHPFNLIDKMTRLIMDDDLENRATVLRFSKAQAAIAEKAVQQFNAKPPVEKRNRPGMMAKPEDVTTRKRKGREGIETTEIMVKVRAMVEGERIVIDTDDHGTQNKFLAIADKLGLDLDVNLSPKLAAFIANFKKEAAAPEKGPFAKQIVFCDMLGMHNKIKLALVKHCGVPASKIAIINAQAIDDPADMQDAQDGFNADGDQNKYQVIIANKKAEVGVNFQRRTQAIHHLTIGWTPDSLTQRNGRGIRQGNILRKVRSYYYDANGTFDEYKRMLVGKKSDWIGAVMGKEGDTDNVRVSGGLSEKELDDLIMASGDPNAVAKARANIERRERERQAAAAREAQAQMLRVLKGQKDWLNKFSKPDDYRKAKIAEYVSAEYQFKQITAKRERAVSPESIAKLDRILADIGPRLEALRSLLEGSSLDWNGKVDAGLGYRHNYKGVAEASGKINPDSTLMRKYEAETDGVKRAAEQARTEYRTLAKRPGAYSESGLAAFDDGHAEVINGRLIAVGMLALHNQEIWIVRREKNSIYGSTKQLEIFLPPNQTKLVANAAGDYDFIGENDEGWADSLKRCAAMDDATIASAEQGFVIGDDRLYSSFMPEVADLLTVVPKSRPYEPRDLELKGPYFQFVIDPSDGEKGGELVKRIIKEQSAVLEWVEPVGRYSYGKRVICKDMSLIHPESGHSRQSQQQVAALVRYAVAHGTTLTVDDAFVFHAGVREIGAALKAHIGAQAGWIEGALAELVPQAKTPDELRTLLNNWIAGQFPFFTFKTDGRFTFKPVDLLTEYETKKAAAAIERIASGGKPVLWLNDMAANSGKVNNGALSNYLRSYFLDNLAAIVTDEGIIPDEEIKAQATKAILGEAFDGIPGAYVVMPKVRDRVIASWEGAVEDGFVMLHKGATIEPIWSVFAGAWDGLRKVKEEAAQFIASKAAGGRDIAGIIQAIYDAGKFDGLNHIEVSKVSSVANLSLDKKASFNFAAGQSIAVTTRFRSGAAEKVQALPTRCWHKERKVWLFTLNDDEKNSNGGGVASLSDLCAVFGVNPDDWKAKD